MPIRMVLADDHVVVRRGLRLLLENKPDFTVVDEASDGAEAIRSCQETCPDVAILDINMPMTNGITAASEIKAHLPKTGIVMLTFQSQLDVIRSSVRAGADGYVLKDAAEHELFEAIRAAAQGRRYMARRAAEIVIDTLLYSSAEDGEAVQGSEELRELSARERQVLQMLAEGNTNNRISETLSVSPKTVETYRSRIMHKLGVASFAELIRAAVRTGLVDRNG